MVFQPSIKLPSFHLQAAISDYFNKVYLYSRDDVEAVYSFDVNISMGIDNDTLDHLSQMMIDIIYTRGCDLMAERRLGSDWPESVITALYLDYMAAIKFAHRVMVDQDLKWSDTQEHFSGFKLTQGSSLLLEMLSSSRKGYLIKDSQSYMHYNMIIQNYDAIRQHVSNRIGQAVFDDYDRQDFVVPKLQSTLTHFLNRRDYPNLDDFYYKVWEYIPNRDPICVADLLLDTPPTTHVTIVTNNAQFDHYKAKKFQPDLNIRLLHAQGINLYSQGLGQIYQFRLTNDTIYKNTVISDNLYFKWTGKPVAALREIRTEIWLGIRYLSPGSVNPNSGDVVPNRPSPSGGGSGGGYNPPSGGTTPPTNRGPNLPQRGGGRQLRNRGGRPPQPPTNMPPNGQPPIPEPGPGMGGAVMNAMTDVVAGVAESVTPIIVQAIAQSALNALLPGAGAATRLGVGALSALAAEQAAQQQRYLLSPNSNLPMIEYRPPGSPGTV